MPKAKSGVVLVEDNNLLRKGLAHMASWIGGYTVLFEAANGKDFISQLQPGALPDIVLLDIDMPVMDGYETALWLTANYPQAKILALSMYNDEQEIKRMIKNGAKGYCPKTVDPYEFKRALNSLIKKGCYYPHHPWF